MDDARREIALEIKTLDNAMYDCGAWDADNGDTPGSYDKYALAADAARSVVSARFDKLLAELAARDEEIAAMRRRAESAEADWQSANDECRRLTAEQERRERDMRHIRASATIMHEAMNAYVEARGPDGGIGVPYDPLYVALYNAFRALPTLGENSVAMADHRPAAEPVAWGLRDRVGTVVLVTLTRGAMRRTVGEHPDIVPLYPAPSASPDEYDARVARVWICEKCLVVVDHWEPGYVCTTCMDAVNVKLYQRATASGATGETR